MDEASLMFIPILCLGVLVYAVCHGTNFHIAKWIKPILIILGCLALAGSAVLGFFLYVAFHMGSG